MIIIFFVKERYFITENSVKLTYYQWSPPPTDTFFSLQYSCDFKIANPDFWLGIPLVLSMYIYIYIYIYICIILKFRMEIKVADHFEI